MKKLGIMIAILLAMAVTAQADVIANWNNEALAAGATSAPVETTHADVSSTAQTFGAGLAASNYPEALTAWANTLFGTLDAAITGNDYFTFTITPDAGKVVSYSDLFLRHTTQANAQPATTVFTLMSSVSGFTSSDGLDTIIMTASAAGANLGSGTFDLSGESALQNVVAGTAVEFRIYAHTTAGEMTRLGIGEAFYQDRDDLTLSGTVVPEPATVGMLGLGALVAVIARRTRRS